MVHIGPVLPMIDRRFTVRSMTEVCLKRYQKRGFSMPSGLYHQLSKRPSTQNRTYRLRVATTARLSAAAEQLGVGVSDLADYLLSEALDQIAAGAIAVPTRTPALRIIDRR